MRSRADRRVRKYPLHVTIASVFALLLLLVGAVLISYNYYESRKIALLSADQQLDRSSQYMQRTISDLYRPAQNLVDVLSRALSPDHTTLEDRLALVPVLVEPFRSNPTISSLFVGYDDGDFFLVRPFEPDFWALQPFEVPAGSRFVAQSIDHDVTGSRTEEWLFFGEDLAQLGRIQIDPTGFDPRQRGWYTAGIGTDTQITTDFYVFFTTHETGLTFARRLSAGGAVVGTDLALRDLSAGLANQRMTPSTKVAILDEKGGVLALSDASDEIPLKIDQDNERIDMPSLSELNDPVYQALSREFKAEIRSSSDPILVAGRSWLVSVRELPTRSDRNVYMAVLIPRDELLASAVRLRNNGALISAAVLLIALVVVLAVSRNISGSLGQLAREAEEVRQLKLDSPITVGSRIREVDDLAETMSMMKSSLRQFLEISDALSAEKDFNKVLEMILAEATRVSDADGGAVLLLSEDEKSLDMAIQVNNVLGTHYGGTSGVSTPIESVELDADRRQNARPSIASGTVEKGTIVKIDDLDLETRFELERIHSHYETESYKVRSLLSVPLRNQLDETIGVLQLVNARDPNDQITGFRPEIVPYIEALSSDAAVALDIRRLLKAQRDLLDSLIHMIAGAIDAKSPYTSGHCRRVPVAARMLAEVASDATEGPLADFHFSDDEWYQLHLASWLHDCGKLTTPEYVVDKATKLETIYNRIHEIRTRFEVLWRDAEIEYYKGLLEGDQSREELRARLTERTDQIRRDFEFIAECNVGDGFMTDEKIERVQQIATQTWTRHLDDRLGLSHGELDLRPEAPTPLPATETLLADKPNHIIPRPAGQKPFGDEPHNFHIEVPKHQYNRGEIHNLSIARGTLTAEERFKINEHVIQTIRMLDQLPFPKEQRRVPDWAGTHHEKLDGTGYPCRLSAADLDVPDRIMAIADIFEALTASDRPYHAPKTLSQTVGIMSSMCSEGHLCPELFSLFLTSGAYLEYSNEHLRPDQIDEVDVDSTVASLS